MDRIETIYEQTDVRRNRVEARKAISCCSFIIINKLTKVFSGYIFYDCHDELQQGTLTKGEGSVRLTSSLR